MFDWQKLKGLQETRAEKLAKMEEIAKKGNFEFRGISSDDMDTYNAASADIDKLDADIHGLEKLRDVQQRANVNPGASAVRNGPPPRDAIGQPTETRADSIAFSPLEKRWCDVVPGARQDSASPLSMEKFVRGVLTNEWEGADAERRAMGVSVGSTAPVPTPLSGDVISASLNKSKVIASGAMVVPLTSSTMRLARVNGNLGASWKQENTGTFPSNDSVIDSVVLTAKTVGAVTKLSLEIQEDSLNISQVVTDALSSAVALAIDQAALFGDGLNFNPTGIVNTAGINQISNIGALTNYDPFSNAVQKIWSTNNTPNAFIINPAVAGAADRLKNGLNDPMRKPDSVQAMAWNQSNNVGIQSAVITQSGGATGGVFTISILLNGQTLTTSNLAYNATSATVQTAIQALAPIGTKATVSGSAGGPYTLTFSASLGVAAVTTDGGANLTGGTSPSIAVVQNSSAFAGDWRNLLIGMRANLNLEMSREAADSNSSAWTNGQIFLRIFARVDCQLARPNAFVYLSGISC